MSYNQQLPIQAKSASQIKHGCGGHMLHCTKRYVRVQCYDEEWNISFNVGRDKYILQLGTTIENPFFSRFGEERTLYLTNFIVINLSFTVIRYELISKPVAHLTQSSTGSQFFHHIVI